MHLPSNSHSFHSLFIPNWEKIFFSIAGLMIAVEREREREKKGTWYRSFFPAGEMAWGEWIPLLIEQLVVSATLQLVGEAHATLSRVHTRPWKRMKLATLPTYCRKRIPTLPWATKCSLSVQSSCFSPSFFLFITHSNQIHCIRPFVLTLHVALILEVRLTEAQRWVCLWRWDEGRRRGGSWILWMCLCRHRVPALWF